MGMRNILKTKNHPNPVAKELRTNKFRKRIVKLKTKHTRKLKHKLKVE